jgi:hypothetical protein
MGSAPIQSGVALRLPPHSKSLCNLGSHLAAIFIFLPVLSTAT